MKTPNKKSLLVILPLLVLVGIGIYMFTRNTGSTNNTEAFIDTEAKTTSDAETAQADFSGGGEREPGNTLHEKNGSVAISDLSGKIDATPNSNQWTKSTSGEITLYSPSEGQTIESGNTISGQSSLDEVQYRIIDQVTGVIASGRLSVVGGKFSASISFNTSATRGSIELFGTKDNGKEFSNVEVEVYFRQD